jgi:hypothetical protein
VSKEERMLNAHLKVGIFYDIRMVMNEKILYNI